MPHATRAGAKDLPRVRNHSGSARKVQRVSSPSTTTSEPRANTSPPALARSDPADDADASDKEDAPAGILKHWRLVAMLALPVSPSVMLAILMGVIFLLGWPLEWPAIVLIFLTVSGLYLWLQPIYRNSTRRPPSAPRRLRVELR